MIMFCNFCLILSLFPLDFYQAYWIMSRQGGQKETNRKQANVRKYDAQDR